MLITQAVFGQKSEWIHFDWHGETIFGKRFDKIAMSIPLSVENLPYKFCAQFDMGATQTLFYGNALKNYPIAHLSSKLDSLKPYYLNGNKGDFLRSIDIKLDQKKFTNTDVAFIYNYGDEIPKDSINSKNQQLIGTVAPDLFQNKYLIIDFPNQRIRTYDALPQKYKKANFVDMIVRKGRIKIPLKVNNKTEYVMFDTGNCLGGLLLDKKSIAHFADSTQQAKEFLTGKQWGKDFMMYQKEIKYDVFLNNRKMPIQYAQFTYYDDEVQFNKEENIVGLIGPLFFINDVVIVDYKNLKFGTLN